MRVGARSHWAGALLLLVALVCAPWPGARAVGGDAGYETICLAGETGMQRLRVELAVNESQRNRGLMGRDSLAPETGMLFIYPQNRPAGSGFWMYRTRIPLDIAWLDAQGTILSVQRMTPCEHAEPGRCPVYRSDKPYRAALEVNAGYFSEHDISAGSRVYRAGDQACPRDRQAQ